MPITSTTEVMGMEKSLFKCPICGDPFNIVPQAAGVMLRCDNNTTCIPHENVYGFGATEKAAYEVACAKYDRQVNSSK